MGQCTCVNAPIDAEQVSAHASLQQRLDYTFQEVARHDKKDDMWIVIDDKVVDVTDFWQDHPVSSRYVAQFAGKDATRAFYANGHNTEYAKQLLLTLTIGAISKINREENQVKRPRKLSVLDWNSLPETGKKDDKSGITVQQIWIYPCKGMKGVQLDIGYIAQSGFLNDRTYVVVDVTDGKNAPVNQLRFPKLALVGITWEGIRDMSAVNTQPVELRFEDERIEVPHRMDAEHMIAVNFVNSSTPIMAYDQGDDAILVANKTINDILMSKKLNAIASTNGNFEVLYVVGQSEADKNVRASHVDANVKICKIGRIDKTHIAESCYKPDPECITFVCGPESFNDSMEKHLKNLGFDEKHIHIL